MYTLICSQCGNKFQLEKLYRNGRTTCSNECRTTLRRSTTQEKYGVDNVSKSKEIKNAKINTFIENYGVTHYFLTDTFKTRRDNTVEEKYGVTHHSKSNKIKIKKKNTMLEKYGVENPSQFEEFREKRLQTHINRFGVTHSAYIGKSAESIELLKNFEKLKELNSTMSLVEICREYKISYTSLAEKFKEHNEKPCRHRCSLLERDIREYVSSLYNGNIEFGNRSILNGKEIDIFLPELNIGIECNGAYWHGELRGRQKYYHLSKMILAESKGIKLMQIWDHEWIMQQPTIKDMLHNILTSFAKREIPFPKITPRDKRIVYEQMGKMLVETTEPSCLYIKNYLDLSVTEIIGADRVWDCGNDIWQL